MGAYIVDTHPLIWTTNPNKKSKISRRVQKIFDNVENGKDIVYVPAPVIWELGAYYRARVFKADKYLLFRHWVQEEVFIHPNLVFLETTLEDVLLAGDFKVNPDPFDNLIVATAIRMDLPLITKDENITLSGACKTVW
jgi:PIN domain nuclease of toxin-antitoxin system